MIMYVVPTNTFDDSGSVRWRAEGCVPPQGRHARTAILWRLHGTRGSVGCLSGKLGEKRRSWTEPCTSPRRLVHAGIDLFGLSVGDHAMSGSGRLLSGDEIVDVLSHSERIFRDGSWSKDKVKGAGYSVRLAGDLLVIPDGPGNTKYTAVPAGGREPSFTLAPGDSALISTIEKFSLDFDITASIGDKFAVAARGLLILHGSTAHPGYGRELDAASALWIPKQDERLYFIIVNVGPTEYNLREGDEIAYLQFFEVERAAERNAVSNVGFDYLSKLFRADHEEDGGLAYFRNVKDLRGETEAAVQSLGSEVQSAHSAMAAEIASLKRDVVDAQTAVDRVANASNTIVVFGVFLVAVTLLGFVLTSISDLIDKLPDHMSGRRLAVIAAMASLYAATSIAGVIFVALAARASGRQALSRRKGG